MDSEPSIFAKLVTHRSRTKFGKSYTEYVIEVVAAGLEWKVYKRFSQFSGLHSQLQAAYSNSKISLPPLPPASMFGNLKLDFILARQKDLATYLASLMSVKDLAESSPLLIFLGALGHRLTDNDGVPEVKRLHLDRLMEIVREGDIVLMKTSGVLQGLTRVFTQGAYDHCGCVVPAPNESGPGTEWALLEATVDGVHYYGLRRRLLSWDLSNAKVVIRRLTIDRSDHTKNVLRDFCVEVDGKPYGLNPIKMLRKTSITDKPSYFCSELVASAFKRLQLLPESVSTGEYLPVSFAQASNLQLLRGKLEDEILIEFHKNEVSECQSLPTHTTTGLTIAQHKQLAKWMKANPIERASVPISIPSALNFFEEKKTVTGSPKNTRSRSPSPSCAPTRRRCSSIPSSFTSNSSHTSSAALVPRGAPSVCRAETEVSHERQSAADTLLTVLNSMIDDPAPFSYDVKYQDTPRSWDAAVN